MSKGIAVIPLAKFTSEADHKLVADLATSVERAAVAAYLRRMAETSVGPASVDRALKLHANAIEQGKHIP